LPPPRDRQLGFAVDIDVADALEMGKDRHACFHLHARDQVLAATRHDDIERPVQPGEHHADGGAIAGRHQRDRRSWQAGFQETRDHRGVDRLS
jgi:hypothetical protein